MPSIEVGIKVPFFDVDIMKIVWHGHYVKYFELARCELLNTIGYGYREMESSGYAWPVVDLRVRYIKSARLGQDIICRATLAEYENQLKIAYEIVCASSGERLTTGHSVQVAVSLQDKVMQLVSPAALIDKVKQL